MALTQAQLDKFHEDGFLIVEDVFDKKDVEAARVEMEKIFYGTSFEDYLAKMDTTGEAETTDPTSTATVPTTAKRNTGAPNFRQASTLSIASLRTKITSTCMSSASVHPT